MNGLWKLLEKIVPQAIEESDDSDAETPAKKSPPLKEETKRESTNSYPSLTSIQSNQFKKHGNTR